MDREGADFLAFEIREAVGGIEQQAARLRVERNGDRVDREIAAPQVLHDAREAVFGFRAGLFVDIVARGGNRAVGVSREDQLVVAELLALPRHSRAAFFEFAHHAYRIAFDGEIQVADRLAGDQVANGAAGEIDIQIEEPGELLHPFERGALLRREPAFQQEHVVRHEVVRLLAAPRWHQARGWCAL